MHDKTNMISSKGYRKNEHESIAQKTNQSILALLYGQSYRVAFSHPVAACIITFWLSTVANINELIMWLGTISFISMFRIILHQAYKKHSDALNYKLWLHVWSGMSALTGIVYAIGFVYFIPFDQPEYVVSVGLFIVGLSSAAVIGYGASIYSILSFFIPITLIPSYFLLVNGGETGLITTLAIGFYAVVVLTLVKNINDAFKKSILLNYQHQQEIEKRKLIEKQLQEISRRDGLTGLFNRRYFDEMLEVEIGRAHRNHSPLCLLMFDIDCFKEYNDHYGHVAGDNCLIAVADIASALANRKGDLLARYGGEEFAVILPNIDIQGAIAFANKLQHSVQTKRISHEASRLTTLKSVTVSIGVTNLMPFSKCKPAELIRQADEALYEAKRQGRNRVHFNENNGLGHSASM